MKVEWVLSRLQTPLLLIWITSTERNFFYFISETWCFRVCTKMHSLEHALKPMGWTLHMPLMVIRIESVLENYLSSPHERFWEKKNQTPQHSSYWLSLIFLKSRFWKETLLCFLYKLRLNVMIMQKKFIGIKMFWQWRKSVSNVEISSRERIYSFKAVFNYRLNRLN